jgi:hypothetical protein
LFASLRLAKWVTLCFRKNSPGFWSLLTTDESIERGQINFWAILETTLAIVAFWYVALHWETFFLLYSSLLIAPLLLLRSEASTKQGVKWLEERFFSAETTEKADVRPEAEKPYVKPEPKPLTYGWAWVGLAIAAGVSLAIGYPAAKSFLSGQVGWAAVWRGAVFAYVLVVVAAALAAVLADAVALIAVFNAAGIAAVEIAAFVGGAATGAGALPVGMMAVLTGLAGFSIARALAYNGAVAKPGTLPTKAIQMGSGMFHIFMYGVARADRYGWLPVAAAVIYFVPVLLLGVLLDSLFIRICATMRHFFDCYAAMPVNLRRLSFFTSPCHTPELVPGLPTRHNLRFDNMMARGKEHFSERGFSDKFLGVAYVLMIPVWFIIGWSYRFILKSTSGGFFSSLAVRQKYRTVLRACGRISTGRCRHGF